jgi:predicted nucleic acid-binding protein
VKAVVIDANVWVSAVDAASRTWSESRAFLLRVSELGCPVVLPLTARVEVACALARRLRNPTKARRITAGLLEGAEAVEAPLDSSAQARALLLGTDMFLSGPDAIYAAEAISGGMTLISWDQELRQRVGAVTPREWMEGTLSEGR